MVIPLPPNPDPERLRKLAKRILRDARAGDATAVARCLTHLPGRAAAPDGTLVLRLSEAQHVLAREHGFASWPRLRAHLSTLPRRDVPRAALLEAAKAGDVDRASELLARDPTLLFEHDGDGLGALELAALYGYSGRVRSHRAMIELLISAGLEVDIFAAAFLDRPARAAELLADDPLLSQAVHPRNGYTPLHYAAERGSVAVARRLIDCGADVDARDAQRRTPLLLAAHAGPWKERSAEDVIQLLLSENAQVDLHLASSIGAVGMLEASIAGAPSLDAQDRGGRTPLYLAAHNNRSDTVRWLVEHGASVDAANADGQTALSTAVLHLASQECDPALVRYLLDSGASADACTAAALGDLDLLRRLLDADPAALERPVNGFTPAYYALHVWQPACLRELARRGARLDILGDHLRELCDRLAPGLLAELQPHGDPMNGPDDGQAS